MSNFNIFLISIFLLSALFFTSSDGATFTIRNNCPYTVWAAASPGGGRRLDKGQTWELNVPAGTSMARIWGRTNCNFDGSGKGHCQTGDCGGILACHEFSPTSGAKDKCRPLFCTADINGQCPKELKAPGGCNNPCTVFKTNKYCCTEGYGSCGPTEFSKFSKADAVMLIVTLRMILQAHLHALVGQTTGLCFALRDLLISPWKWSEKMLSSKGIHIHVLMSYYVRL
ncbi:hypothetical protein GH714_002714 [Hevea brasiliensis]|uniref:Thaumatin-like protein n=1 Tax=Hevea brasiliensis TaxID=3981 RepID=A0A6A6L9W1_HEVBR|nr:hypothetical protein GH714_002714 [Hevea brasiliensis]